MRLHISIGRADIPVAINSPVRTPCVTQQHHRHRFVIIEGSASSAALNTPQAILSLSPYFRAQLDRWSSSNDSGSNGSSSPTIALGLESPTQLPAAMTVLSAMYGLDPDPCTLLPDQQLLQVVLVADMLQLADITKAAVEQLLAVISQNKMLSGPAKQQLMRLPALPACLLDEFPTLADTLRLQDCLQLWLRSAGPCSPAGLDAVLAAPHSSYLQQRLIDWVRGGGFGQPDLEAALDSPATRQELMQLPLPAMQLLLASDSLKVYSEDTVLFTAQAYVSAQASTEQQQTAAQQLAPLIRCPHLSQLWLTAMVASPYASKLLLGPYIPQIQRLLPFMMAYCPAGSSTTDSSMWQQLVPHAPASWKQQQRPQPSDRFRSAHEVDLSCSFSFPEVHELFTQASKKQRTVYLAGRHTTRPLCGLVWRLELHACWQPEQQTTTLGLFAAPVNCPPGMFFRYNATIGSGSVRRDFVEPADAFGNKGSGFSDFYSMGAVSAVQPAGGWSPLMCQKLSHALHIWPVAPGAAEADGACEGAALRVFLTVSKAD